MIDSPDPEWEETAYYNKLPDASNSILQIADELVDEKRAVEYGSIAENAFKAIGAYRALAGRYSIETAKDHCLYMVCYKLARELTVHKRDNLIDGCGYLKLLDELNGSI